MSWPRRRHGRLCIQPEPAGNLPLATQEERYEQAVGDLELLSCRNEVALLHARVAELARRMPARPTLVHFGSRRRRRLWATGRILGLAR